MANTSEPELLQKICFLRQSLPAVVLKLEEKCWSRRVKGLDETSGEAYHFPQQSAQILKNTKDQLASSTAAIAKDLPVEDSEKDVQALASRMDDIKEFKKLKIPRRW